VGCVPWFSRFQQGWGFGLWMEGCLGWNCGFGADLMQGWRGGVLHCGEFGGIVEKRVLRFAQDDKGEWVLRFAQDDKGSGSFASLGITREAGPSLRSG